MPSMRGRMKTKQQPCSADRARLRRDLDARILQHGLRSTEPRRLIIDALFASTGHLTIENLHQQVLARDARVGYATVYRTMKLLGDIGVVHMHHFGDGFTRYELADASSHHDHLVCLECGDIAEFEEPRIETLQQKLAQRAGFLVKARKREMYGVCAACQRRQATAR